MNTPKVSYLTSTTKAIGVLFAVFLTGSVCGFTVGLSPTVRGRIGLGQSERVLVGSFDAFRARRSGELPEIFTDLNLSAEQSARVRAVLAAARPEVDSLLLSTMPRVRFLADSVRLELAKILSPSQRRELRNRLVERGARFNGPTDSVRPPLPMQMP